MKLRNIIGISVLACAPLFGTAQTPAVDTNNEEQNVSSLADMLKRDQQNIEDYREHKQNFEKAVAANNMGAAKEAQSQILVDMRQELIQEKGKLNTSSASGEEMSEVKATRKKILDRQEEIMNDFASMRISGAVNQDGQLSSMITLLNEYEGLMEQQIGLVKKEIRIDVKEVEK